MEKLRQILDFIQYLIAAWQKAFGGGKNTHSDADQTTAETMDRDAWESAKRKYQEEIQKQDEDFWKGENK